MKPLSLIADSLSRMLNRTISAAAWVGDGVRRMRYRRAELLRMSPVTTDSDVASADEAFEWLGTTTVRGRPCLAVISAPSSSASYDVTLPANSVVRSWCRLAGDSTSGTGGVEFELRLKTTGAELSATCRLQPGARGDRWRALRIRAPEAGPAQVVLITRSIEGAAPGKRSALWAAVRIEWPRPLAQLMWVVRSAISERRIRGLRRRTFLADSEHAYRLWARAHEPSRRALRAQRRRVLGSLGSPGSPGSRVFTLITFIDEPAVWRPGRTAESVLSQSYTGWEWILITTNEATAECERITARVRRDRRVRLLSLPTGTTRADAWNAGMQEARGEFVALLGRHDTLAPAALYEMAGALERWPGADLLYSDEDCMASDSRKRHDPQFKPDWSPELLLAGNYVGGLAMVRVRTAKDAGGFRSCAGSHAEWDLFLRLSHSTDRIHRVPRCLYHRDDRNELSAEAPGEREAAAVVQNYWQGRGVQATVSKVGDAYRSIWPVQGNPLVSIVIPNRNAAAVFTVCVRGLLQETSYRRHELIIVDNGSTDREVLDLYREVEAGGHGRIVPFDRPFNYSAACNAGAAAAHGDLLLFLNNDIEVIEPDWLDELIRWAQRPEVGIVGAKLLFPDRTIQHAGVAFGPSGLVDHIFAKAPEGASGVFGSSDSYRNYLAVTGACQMMRKDVFRRIGGFDERFRISFGDVVLCLEAWKAGYRVVYTPYARLVHHESYSRKRQDLTQDLELLARYLRTHGFADDPYFHPELSSESLVPVLRPPFDRRPREVVNDFIDRMLSSASLGVQGG